MKDEHAFDFEAVAFWDNGIGYAAAFEFNGLYEVDLAQQTCRFIMLFPNEDILGKRIYCSAIYHDWKVYFIPMSGNYISIFDRKENKIEQLRIPEPSEQCSFYKKSQKFSHGVLYEGNIYLFPFTYPGIIRMDVITRTISVINNWIPKEGYFFRGGMYVDGAHVYAPNGVDNMVLDFNMRENKAAVYRVGKNNHGGMCIYKHGDWIWIIPRLKGAVIRWNISRGEINELADFPDGFHCDKIVFSKVLFSGNALILMPASANRVIKIDVDTKEMTVDDRWIPHEDSMVACMFETEDHVYLREASNIDDIFYRYKICKTDWKIESYRFIVKNDDDRKREFFNHYKEKKDSLQENKDFGLDDFLNLI